MTRSHIALGGNVGDVAATFRSALDDLASRPGVSVIAVSSHHGTRPVGESAGGEFLNAAATLETSLTAADLLALLHEVEARHQRTREIVWGPRTLDLDLLLHGETVLDEPHIRVPHPAAWYRRFVLDPLVGIAADVVHPVKRATIADLRERLLPRPMRLSLCGGRPGDRTDLANALERAFADRGLDVVPERDSSAAILAWLGAGDDVSNFDELPRLPRLDASSAEEPVAFLQGVAAAALG